uniref:G protein-coupled receptor n=1 Tax=Panagrolaimus sp. JU765 TaxID=591449 RepID=A0AC34PYE9_9BILA
MAHYVFVNGTACAINTAVFYRYLTAKQKDAQWFTNKIFLVFLVMIHVFTGLPMIIAHKTETSNDPLVHQRWIQKNVPKFSINIGHNGEKPRALTIVVLATLILHGICGVYFGLGGIRKYNQTLTKRFKEMQKELFAALFLQVLLPFVCLILPFLATTFSSITKNDQLSGKYQV